MVRAADANPLDLMRQGIRSEETRHKYLRTLKYVLCKVFEDMLEGTFEERAAQLVRLGRDDPEWARDLLLNLSRKLRERTELPRNDKDYLNPITFSNYFIPIKKLFDMNDVAMPWKRIRSTYPELDNVSESRGWTREEIARMLKYARDSRDRALVLLLASSGMRAGAPHQLNWGDLTPIYRNGGKLTLDPGEGSDVACAMLNVYRGSAESYMAFITPEAFAALQEYALDWAGRMGRQAGPDDPMFIIMRYAPKRATLISIRKRIIDVVKRAGLRAGRDGKMHRVPLMNGFRRFFNKTCKEALSGNSTLGSLIKHEFMMGHSGLTSLDENYFKTNALELAAEYVKAVPDLTIDDAERLRRSNRTMAENIQHMEDEKDGKIARLEAEMGRMASERYAEAARMRSEMERVRREKDEAVERVREEVAEIRDRGGATAGEILDALRKSPKAGGVPGDVAAALTTMMRQLGAAQETAMRDMKDSHNAAMADMKADMKDSHNAAMADMKADMKAEYDAKMERLLRMIGRTAKDGDAGHDPLAEFRGDGTEDGLH